MFILIQNIKEEWIVRKKSTILSVSKDLGNKTIVKFSGKNVTPVLVDMPVDKFYREYLQKH